MEFDFSLTPRWTGGDTTRGFSQADGVWTVGDLPCHFQSCPALDGLGEFELDNLVDNLPPQLGGRNFYPAFPWARAAAWLMVRGQFGADWGRYRGNSG